MHIHHHVAHGLRYTFDPEELTQMELAEDSFGEEDWEEIEAEQYDDEVLASNVIAFLHETGLD